MTAEAEETTEDGHRVFVYGSLKRGGSNHGLLAEAEREGEAVLEGLEMWDTGRGFPAVVPGEGRVEGEVYRVDDATLAAVDRLEGHPTMYERRRVGGLWVYVWADGVEADWEPVPEGVWTTTGTG